MEQNDINDVDPETSFMFIGVFDHYVSYRIEPVGYESSSSDERWINSSFLSHWGRKVTSPPPPLDSQICRQDALRYWDGEQ